MPLRLSDILGLATDSSDVNGYHLLSRKSATSSFNFLSEGLWMYIMKAIQTLNSYGSNLLYPGEQSFL